MPSAGDFLESSQNLAKATYQAWETIWTSFFDTSVPGLWTGMVALALAIAGLAFIHLALTWFPSVITSEPTAIRQLVQPLALFFIVVALLGADGKLLSWVLEAVRGIGLKLTRLPLDVQLAGIRLGEALDNVAVEGGTEEEIRTLIANCQGAVGEEFARCLDEAVGEAQSLVAAVEMETGVDLAGTTDRLQDILQGIAGAANPLGQIDDLILNGFLILLQGFCYALQWAFVNGLEIVLLGVFSLTPIIISFLFTEIGPKLFYGWLVKIFGLYTTQLVYNIITGLIALVINTGDFTRIAGIRDLALAVFLGVVAPILSLVFGYGEFVKAFEQGLQGGSRLAQLGGAATTSIARGSTNLLGRTLGFRLR